MNAKLITEYNTEALKDISIYLKFSQFEQEPIAKEIAFSNYSEIGFAISTIFSAIETIGFSGEKSDLSICAGLAQLGKKLVPSDELEFLDRLLIKKEDSNTGFSKIENL